MSAPQTPPAGQVGEAPPPGDLIITDAHWTAAADAVTGQPTEALQVAAVARAIADAEQRGRDDVRFGSAWCPDCGVHVAHGQHDPSCPWAAIPLRLEHR